MQYLAALAVSLVYLHMRSTTLSKRIDAAVAAADPVSSTTDIMSKDFRNLSQQHERFHHHLPKSAVETMQRALATHRQSVRDFDSFRNSRGVDAFDRYVPSY